jgi:hypothetical protein
MRREAVYEAWVPPGGVWSLWARPILFAQMPDTDQPDPAAAAAAADPWTGIDVAWAPDAASKTVLVIDLPGKESVLTGLALAGRGYRPVPVYNACTGQHEVIDQGPIIQGLRAGAAYLQSLALPAEAPPAFLLDDNRMNPVRDLRGGVFDNRWKVFPQDLPSARFLRARGFARVLLAQRGRRVPQEDLAHVVRRWQDEDIEVEGKDVADAAPPGLIRVNRPAWYRRVWYRLRAALGLRRSFRGGFGGEIPTPSHG